jgi:hypothetical protein
MISVQATVYTDAKKTTVADAASLDTLIPLAPGATLPFDLTDWQVLNNKAGLWDTLSKQNTAVALRIEPFRTWTTDISVKPLTVIADTPAFQPREATFTGQVKNETDGNVILGTVTVVLRDAVTEKIIATNQADLDIVNAFPVGEMMSYSIAIPLEPGFDPQRVQVEITASGQQT